MTPKVSSSLIVSSPLGAASASTLLPGHQHCLRPCHPPQMKPCPQATPTPSPPAPGPPTPFPVAVALRAGDLSSQGCPEPPVLRASVGEQVSEFPAILSRDLHEQQAGRGAGKVIPQKKALERKAEAGVGVSVGMGTAGTGRRLPGLPIRARRGPEGKAKRRQQLLGCLSQGAGLRRVHVGGEASPLKGSPWGGSWGRSSWGGAVGRRPCKGGGRGEEEPVGKRSPWGGGGRGEEEPVGRRRPWGGGGGCGEEEPVGWRRPWEDKPVGRRRLWGGAHGAEDGGGRTPHESVPVLRHPAAW